MHWPFYFLVIRLTEAITKYVLRWSKGQWSAIYTMNHFSVNAKDVSHVAATSATMRFNGGWQAFVGHSTWWLTVNTHQDRVWYWLGEENPSLVEFYSPGWCVVGKTTGYAVKIALTVVVPQFAWLRPLCVTLSQDFVSLCIEHCLPLLVWKLNFIFESIIFASSSMCLLCSSKRPGSTCGNSSLY